MEHSVILSCRSRWIDELVSPGRPIGPSTKRLLYLFLSLKTSGPMVVAVLIDNAEYCIPILWPSNTAIPFATVTDIFSLRFTHQRTRV